MNTYLETNVRLKKKNTCLTLSVKIIKSSIYVEQHKIHISK